MRRENNFKIMREENPTTDVPNEEGRGFQNTDGVDPKQGRQRMNIEQGRGRSFKRARGVLYK